MKFCGSQNLARNYKVLWVRVVIATCIFPPLSFHGNAPASDARRIVPPEEVPPLPPFLSTMLQSVGHALPLLYQTQGDDVLLLHMLVEAALDVRTHRLIRERALWRTT